MTLTGHLEMDKPHSLRGRARGHLCQLRAPPSLAACLCEAPCLGSWHGGARRRQEPCIQDRCHFGPLQSQQIVCMSCLKVAQSMLASASPGWSSESAAVCGRWWKLWKPDVREGWEILGRYRVSAPPSCWGESALSCELPTA